MMPISVTVVRDVWDRLALASTLIAAVLALVAIIVGMVAIHRGNSIARNADEALVRERRMTFELDVLARIAEHAGAGTTGAVRGLLPLLPDVELSAIRRDIEEGRAPQLAVHMTEYLQAVDRRMRARSIVGLRMAGTENLTWLDRFLRTLYTRELRRPRRKAATQDWP